MSKDLLKEAIADAKAVRETAIANAKLALEEAFTPKLQSMLSTKIREDYEEDEEEEDMDISFEESFEDEEDVTADAEMDFESEDLPAEEDEVEEAMYSAEQDQGLEDEDEDSLELEAIIRELEGEDEFEEEEEVTVEAVEDEVSDEEPESEESDIDLEEVIRALQEEDEDEEVDAVVPDEDDLEEAYKTIRFLKDKINEVNLLNAKLLFSNKLFRNGNLNEDQKMRVIETFDRASSVREVKLVYSTLAESMKSLKSTTKKKSMTEGLASKSTRSTKPSKAAIVESKNFSDRMRKLAGLI